MVPLPAPEPGTVNVRLGARIEVDFMAASNPGYPGAAAVAAVNGTTNAAGAVTKNATGAVAAVAPGKFNPISFGSYLRLYPGVDGQTAGGLRYGAQAEIRENFQSGGSDPYPTNNPAASPSASTSAETLYVRRAFLYVAADNFGLIRFGQADGVIGLFDPCYFGNACNDAGFGGFQTGLGGLGATSNIANNGDYFVLAQNGAEYGNTKLVYLSPQIFGVDVGVQYAPNMENSNAPCSVAAVNQTPLGASNTGILPTPSAGQSFVGAGAASGCTNATSGTDGTRWYNQVAIGARWMGDFGTFHAGAYAVYEAAMKESNYAQAVAKTATWNGGYANLSFVNAAFYLRDDTPIGTFMGALTYSGGNVNTTLTMTTQGGAKLEGFQGGITYINGPWIAGVNTFWLSEQGTTSLTGISQRHETGILGTVNYNVAPGLDVNLEYQYQARHQGNFNFITGANNGANNDIHGQAVIVTTAMNW